ncbi:MAG: indolepyruvate ferredoxin oxidoreductase [Deltaproteobacteria bacterium]|nr:indolepyruvate ferredoxin oxidoreductase [Deltaproteobacteria bacterium]
MQKELLLGDEAVAQAALHAGIGGAFAYPGTPATEIFEHVERVVRRHALPVATVWSTNEKVAYEEALGMSYAGRRALVSMKHVGLNVAADPFLNSALSGVNSGLVLAVADDPGMHSSQNEQDSRVYGDFAQVPIFEPATQQEAYDLTLKAFAASEALGLPVMLRLVTRLAHSRAGVAPHGAPVEGAALPQRPLPDPSNWTLVPANARRRFAELTRLQARLVAESECAPENELILAGRRGVIAAGHAVTYVREALGGATDRSLLKVGRYPLPVARIRELVDHCDELLVVEESYPFIERRLTGLLGLPGKAVRGKLTGDLPPTGELTPELVARALGLETRATGTALSDLANRPPQLCRGCPHADSFKALVEAVATFANPLLFSDIGCYTLGVMPPYRAVHACVDMGASIAMAHGAARAGAYPVLCTIGDSTFGHSGMTALLSALHDNADCTVLLLDNSAVAMTGVQPSHTTGERLLAILRGLGVPEAHLHVIEPHPKHHAENVALLKQAIAHRGLSVVVAERACIHLKTH